MQMAAWRPHQCAVNPPSTIRLCPVTKTLWQSTATKRLSHFLDATNATDGMQGGKVVLLRIQAIG